MELVVDGLIYQMQAHGGISRIFNEILPRMCEMEPDLYVQMFTSGLCLQRLPEHEHIHHDPPPYISRMLYPSGFWNQLYEKWLNPDEKYARRSGESSIWHSTYYTQPRSWNGKKVVTVVDMIQEKFPGMFADARNDLVRERKRRSLQSADAVICISETTRQDVIAIGKIPPEKTHVVHLAHSGEFQVLNGTSADSGGANADTYILYVGTRDAYKNFDTLLHAYHRWKGREDFALWVVGLPWTAEEQLLISQLALSGRVRLLRDLDDQKLARLYNQAGALVYPSLYEGFGIPLLEAMACGCPIIASYIPSTAEIAGEIPIYFDPQDVDSLVDALESCIHEGRNSARTQKGVNCAGKFSWQRTASKTIDIYRLLLQ